MENKVSVITVPHMKNCMAVQWVKDKYAPSEWDVWRINPIPCCDNNGKENPPNTGGSLYYEFSCADDACPARKRVHAQSVVQL